jgi:hypothetical protein
MKRPVLYADSFVSVLPKNTILRIVERAVVVCVFCYNQR